MGNKYEANIILCETITEENEFYGLFNNIVIGNDKNNKIAFDVGLFITVNVEDTIEEMLLLDIAYLESEDGYSPINPIASVTKENDKKGISRELSVLRENEIDFRWEGLYSVELRRCKEVVDLNNVSESELLQIIKDGEIINSFTFQVEFEK